MKRSIFKVIKDSENQLNPPTYPDNDDNNDEKYDGRTADVLLNDEKGNSKSNNKALIFITEKTTKPSLSLQTSISIWKKYEEKINMYDMIKFIKKEFINSLIMYINNMLISVGIEGTLLPLGNEIIDNVKKKFNKKLMNSRLKYIFSGKMTKKGNKTNFKHNAQLIKKIYDENKFAITFLLNKTFLQWFEHFRRTKYIIGLLGLDSYFDKTIQKIEKNKNDNTYFINVLNNFERYFDLKKQSSKIKVVYESSWSIGWYYVNWNVFKDIHL